ncbi:hypothetical protein D9611_001099 [Ephemerocybe angulata]|uniref:Uncharacterized protein n=1 Tax=Ephemerocybe angulata TaxID=980116 RepID=A0A8H5FM64_9AGAR|nr:hypothetical protein D9611_001099 [Tulosesus angulatus]
MARKCVLTWDDFEPSQAVEDDTVVTLFTFSDELEAYYRSQGFTVEGKVDIPSPLGSWVHREMMWVSPTTE